MSSLNIGNGNWAVKEDNLLGYRYDETEGVFLPREMTFSRASDGTRVNPDGLIERVPYNLLQYSEEFDNAAWSRSNVTVTANTTTAPDGTLTADLLDDGTASSTQHWVYQAIALSNSTTYTISFYAKYVSRKYMAVNIYNGSTSQYVVYDIQNGSVYGSTGDVTASITSAGNGWYRVVYTRTIAASGSPNFRIAMADDTGSETYTGSNKQLYLWGAQLNAGTLKDYFPTTNRQDIARIDYSSGRGALLLEPQRTNIHINSQQMWSMSPFGATPPTRVQASIDSPEGVNNAVIVTGGNGSSGSWGIFQLISTSISSGNSVAVSVFAKAGTHDKFFLQHSNISATGTNSAYFDLSNGTTPTWGAKIEDYGNGWYRCYMPIITLTANTGGSYNIGHYITPSTTSNSWTTNFEGKSVYFYGIQVEAGSYATSYIPTTSASVTRLADSCYKTGVADWIGQTEGTVFLDANFDEADRINFGISDGTSANYVQIESTSVNAIVANIVASSSSQASMNTTASFFTIGQRLKIAIAYNTNDFAFYVNGLQIAIDTSGSVPATNQMRFARYNGSLAATQKVNQATIYKTRLSNSELAALTTI